MAVEYVEKPDERQAIYDKALRMVALIFAGAHATHAFKMEQEIPQTPQLINRMKIQFNNELT